MVGRGDPTAPQEEFVPQFDDDGNQTLIKTATGIWSVTYNGENRPIFWTCTQSNNQTITNNQTISMTYDRMGRRVTKNNQRFVYDGYLQIANFELSTSNSELQTFIWDPTEPIATRPLVWGQPEESETLNFEPSTLNFYTHDANKNVSEVVSEGGYVTAHCEYAPFGATTAQRGERASTNPWRFSSEYKDDALELVYYNYRHYDSSIGKWVRRDTLDEEANLYAYVKNLTCGKVDILGLRTDSTQMYLDPKFQPKLVSAGTFIQAPGTPVPMKWVYEMVSNKGMVKAVISWEPYCDWNNRPFISGVTIDEYNFVDKIDYVGVSLSDLLGEKVQKALKGIGISVQFELGAGWILEAKIARQETARDNKHCVSQIVELKAYGEVLNAGASISLGTNNDKGPNVSAGTQHIGSLVKPLLGSQELELRQCCCPSTSSFKQVGGVVIERGILKTR